MTRTAQLIVVALTWFGAMTCPGEEAFPLAAGKPYRWSYGATTRNGDSSQIRFIMTVSRMELDSGRALLRLSAASIELPELIKADGATISQLIVEVTTDGQKVSRISLPGFDAEPSRPNREAGVLIAEEILSKALVQFGEGAARLTSCTIPEELIQAIEHPRLKAVCRAKVYQLERHPGTPNSNGRVSLKSVSKTGTDTTTAVIDLSPSGNEVMRAQWQRVVGERDSEKPIFEHFSEISRLN